MQFPAFTKNEAVVLALLAAFGFFVPNGVFVYFVFQNPALIRGALANPLALVFVLEAFFLMFVVAWLLARAGVRKPSALGFVLMSLAGSLAFSVPASLWLAAKKSGRE
jgi:hypothetical protein